MFNPTSRFLVLTFLAPRHRHVKDDFGIYLLSFELTLMPAEVNVKFQLTLTKQSQDILKDFCNKKCFKTGGRKPDKHQDKEIRHQVNLS